MSTLNDTFTGTDYFDKCWRESIEPDEMDMEREAKNYYRESHQETDFATWRQNEPTEKR